LADGDPVWDIRRVRLGDGRPIALEHSVFPAAGFPGLLRGRLDGSLYDRLDQEYARRPCRARESLEPVTAGPREAAALEVPPGAPLMLVERTAFDGAGRPVEYARDLFRGDRTRIVIWTAGLAAVR
jgi:GntR family transcriptional regulator